MLNLLIVFAEESAKAQPQGELPFIFYLAPILMVLFYFIVLRPEKRRAQTERDALLKTLKKNDRVITSAGIYGTVISVSDTEDEVVVKVDDNTRLRMIKASILRNVTNEEAAKAEKDAKNNPKKEGAA